MNKLTILLSILILVLNKNDAQSPILTAPPYYYDVVLQVKYPLPTPEPSVVDPANYLDFIGGYQSQMFSDGNGLEAYYYDGRPAKSCSNSIFGPNGELLAFIIDEYVFDKDGNLLDILKDSPYYNVGSTYGLSESEIAVIPHSDNCNIYYLVFTSIGTRSYNITGSTNLITQVSYAILDLSLDRSQKDNNTDVLGGLVPFPNGNLIMDLYLEPLDACLSGYSGQGIPRSGFSGLKEKEGNFAFAVTPLNLNNERFLFLEQNGYVHRFVINSNGIELDNSKSDYTNNSTTIQCDPNNHAIFTDSYLLSVLSLIPNTGTIDPLSSRFTRGELEVVMMPNGDYRLGFTYSYRLGGNGETLIVSFDFSNNGVFIPGSENIIDLRTDGDGTSYLAADIPTITGFEFSPSGNILYTVMQGHPNYLSENVVRFYDYSNPVLGMQHLPIADEHDFESGYIEMGLNNNLIISGNGKLGHLSNVETPDHTNFTSSAVSLPGFVLSTNYVPSGNTNPNIKSHAYPLPDQIDGEDWQDRFTTTCCKPATGGGDDFTAEAEAEFWTTGVSNNPWNATGAVYITGNITIPSGADVTISGMEFFFSEESQIDIHPNGKLTIDNTLLTANVCDDHMWQGVRVWGNPTLSPALTNQGYFKMQDSSEISYAYIGVANYKTSVNASFMHYPNYLGNEGGRIVATDSKFRNNFKGSVVSNYVFQSSSYPFKNCTYITDVQLPHGLTPAIHATVSNSTNVTFLGCDFENSTIGVYADNQRGIGVFGADGKFTVSYQCSNFVIPCAEVNRDKSTFKGLYKGVSAVNTIANRPAVVKFAEFDSVTQGIYLGSVDDAICVDNKIKHIGPTINSAEGTFGIYISRSTGYTIENNYISGYGNTVNNIGGIIVKNTNNDGAADFVNRIYNNDIEDVDYGILGLKENVKLDTDGNPVTNKGLQFFCNTFKNSEIHDIAWVNGGIMPDQGGTYQIAGNEFSSIIPSGGDYWNYNIGETSAGSGVYTYHVDYAHFSDTAGRNVKPQDYNLNTNRLSLTGTFNPTIHCKTNYFDGRIIFRPKSTSDLYEFEQLAAEAKILETELINIDGMASSLMVKYKSNIISSSDLMTGLTNLGPWISDEILIEVSELSSQIAHNSIKDVMQDNSPLSPEVLYAVKKSLMPTGVSSTIAKLSAESGSISARKSKEMMINAKLVESAINRNKLISFYIHDTVIIDGVEKVKEIYAKSGAISDKQLLIDLLISNGENKKAQQLTDSIKGLNDNTEYYAQLVDVLLNPSETDEQKLFSIYEQDTSSREGARAYARLIRDYDYPLNVYVSYPMRSKSLRFESFEGEYSNSLLTIYPNPSEGIFNIFIDDEENTNGTIQVYDNLGKVVITSQLKSSLGYIEMSSFEKGIYHVVIATEDGETYTERVVLK